MEHSKIVCLFHFPSKHTCMIEFFFSVIWGYPRPQVVIPLSLMQTDRDTLGDPIIGWLYSSNPTTTTMANSGNVL